MFYAKKENACMLSLQNFNLGYYWALDGEEKEAISKLQSDILKRIPSNKFDIDYQKTHESFEIFCNAVIDTINEEYPQYKDLLDNPMLKN